MEISFHLNPRIMVSMPNKANPNRHSTISTTYNKLSHNNIMSGQATSSSSSTRDHQYLETMKNKKKANFYEVLSLGSKNVGLQEIKKAYRSMALQYHPDVCPDPSAKEESTRRFLELQKAYETLSDPVSRKIYDHELCFSADNYSHLGFGVVERTTMFRKEVWENQLRGLKRRSQIRMKRRQYN